MLDKGRKQVRLPRVSTVIELLKIDTTELQHCDLCNVDELDGIPPRDPRLPITRWGSLVVFLRKLESDSGENDTWWRAPTGGFWLRARDIP